MKEWNFGERESRTDSPFAWNSVAHRLACVLLTVWLGGAAIAQSAPLVLEPDGRVISLELYAANIVRVTMSIDKAVVLRRDGGRCQSCGTMSNLEVHHKEFRSHAGQDSELNLITLCGKCHARAHGT